MSVVVHVLTLRQTQLTQPST